jgi:ABC-type branched-subunit amino acid transport system ATPase component
VSGVAAPAARPQSAAPPAEARAAHAGDPLCAVDVVKAFGGLVALDHVSLELRPGEVHGLIGPNGSGKTTMLNMLSGYYEPTSGTVTLGGERLEGASVQRRATLGVARTFQKPRLLPTLSVLENAMLGAWVHARAGFLGTAFGLPRAAREDAVARERAAELLHGVGLGHAIGRRANLLEHAEQRFLESPRAAWPPTRSSTLATSCARCATPASACCWSSTTPTSCSASATASPPSTSGR